MGKYVVKKVPSGIKFDLHAGNGEIIAISEVYSSKQACLKGIDSVRRCAPAANVEDQTQPDGVKVLHPKFEIYTDRAGQFRFRLKAANGEIIASSEGYTTKSACINGVSSVKANAAQVQVIEQA